MLRRAEGSWHWSISVKVHRWLNGHGRRASYSPRQMQMKTETKWPLAVEENSVVIINILLYFFFLKVAKTLDLPYLICSICRYIRFTYN